MAPSLALAQACQLFDGIDGTLLACERCILSTVYCHCVPALAYLSQLMQAVEAFTSPHTLWLLATSAAGRTVLF